MNNLDKYQLNKSILNQEDYVLELWYGKAGLFFISKLRKVDRIEVNSIGNINYYNNDKWLLHYDTKSETFWISHINIWSVLISKYQLNNQQIKDLTKGVLGQITNCKVITTKFTASLEQVTNCKVSTTIELDEDKEYINWNR